MSRYTLGAVAITLSIGTPLLAQPTSRLQRAIEASRPKSDTKEEERRKAQNESAKEDRVQDVVGDERLLRMPDGTYMIAPEGGYRPDHWSPRIRARNDYSGASLYRHPGYRHSHHYRSFSNGWDGTYYSYAYPPELNDAYLQGRYDADHEYQDYIAASRAGRLLAANRQGIADGMEHFQAGRYDRAAIEWIGAADRNHGDAASRVHAGHALFAIGRYDEAVKHLSRAFELAPFLTESYYDVRSAYGNAADFNSHLLTLKTFVAAHPGNVASMTLLGYIVAFTEGPAAAHPILEKANELKPNDFFIGRLLKIARTVTPMPGVTPASDNNASRNGTSPSSQKQTPLPKAMVRKVAVRWEN